MFKNSFILLSLLMISTNVSVVLAAQDGGVSLEKQDANLDANPKPVIPVDTANSAVANASVLRGGVEKVELGLAKLQDVEIDLKTAMRATTSMTQEVTRQAVRVITQPNPLPNGTIINLPVGTEPVGPPQPARKEYIEAALKRMTPIINTLKKNVDEFVSGEKQLDLPEDVMTKLQPEFQLWVKSVNNLAYKMRHLEQITYGPPYDNLAIAELSNTMTNNLKDLEAIRLSIYKVIKKEGKRKSR
jgi:hypothetical protein